MGVPQHHPMVIYGDNQSAINLLKNLQFHKRNKHIDVQYHFVHEKYKNKEISIDYINTNNQVANIMTKFLPHGNFQKFHHLMGVVNMNSLPLTTYGKQDGDMGHLPTTCQINDDCYLVSQFSMLLMLLH